jgi:hypothetical protein
MRKEMDKRNFSSKTRRTTTTAPTLVAATVVIASAALLIFSTAQQASAVAHEGRLQEALERASGASASIAERLQEIANIIGGIGGGGEIPGCGEFCG